MRIVIDSSLHLSDVPADFAEWLMAALTMKNPEFTKKTAMGIPIWGIPRELIEYTISTDEDGAVFTVPRGFAERVCQDF